MLDISVSHKKCTFLIDTQADISLIKLSVVKPRECLDVSQLINITGITEEPISTLGCLAATFKNDDFQLDFPLHVVPDYFHIPSDGILGKDFMKSFRCNINYDEMLLSFFLGDRLISLPMLEGPSERTIVLPARSEVIRRFNLRQSVTQPTLICSQELKAGVFIARTIVNSQQPLLKLLNTTNQVLTIRNDKLELDDLSEYDVFNLDKTDDTEDRTKVLIDILREATPEYCQLCKRLKKI